MGTAKGSHGGWWMVEQTEQVPILSSNPRQRQRRQTPAPASMRIHKQTGGTGGRRSEQDDAHRRRRPTTTCTHAPRPARAAAPKPAPVLSSLQRCKPPTQATTQALQSSPPSPASPASRSIHPRRPPPPSTLATAHCPLPSAHCPLPRDLGNPHPSSHPTSTCTHVSTHPRTHPRIHSPLHCRPVRSQGCGNPSFHTGTRSAAGRTPVTPVCTIAESAAARCRPDAASPPAHEKRCTCSRPLLRARACHDSTHSTNPTYSLLLRAPPASEPVAPRQSSLPTPTSASPSSIRHPLSAAYPLCCA
jgi:hypothetical protein